MSTSRNATFYSAAIKLTVFTIVSVIVTGFLALVMGKFGFGDTTEYRALFATASQLEEGDDVKVAGVTVGQVKDIEIKDRVHALVTFDVQSEVPLTTASVATIRYLNVIGDRYLALQEGPQAQRAAAERLAPGDTIGLDKTVPALDLSELFNGFKPLFAALSPDQINELSMNVIRVLQGEGGTVEGLLAKTASLTSTLADRDELIGQVIGNLADTLDTLDSRRNELSTVVVELRDWMRMLARDRETIGGSIDNISDLTLVVANLLNEGRPLLKADIAELRQLATLLNKKKNREAIVGTLERAKDVLTSQAKTGTYGSWYQYYLCGFQVRLVLPSQGIPGLGALDKLLNQFLADTTFKSPVERCNNNGGQD